MQHNPVTASPITKEWMDKFRLPRYEQLPELGLYLDQALSYVTGVIQPLYGSSVTITGAMVSNYIKTGALDPSVKKKYSREHLARLVVISLLKEVFTVPEICTLFQVQKETYPLGVAYDFFCTEFENALRETFFPTGNPLPMVATQETAQTVLIRAMVLTAVNRLFVQKTTLSLAQSGRES